MHRHLRLGVNVDHVATVRNARGIDNPDPVRAAKLAIEAGADGITAHLREDRRHIVDADIERLAREIDKPLNLEMAATEEMVAVALRNRPHAACIVPEKREELTTEGGLDVRMHRHLLQRQIELLKQGGIRVSLFVDPDIEQIKACHRVGGDYIEIHTGAYSEAKSARQRQEELRKIELGVRAGHKLGLGVNAGHGLNYTNVRDVVSLGGVEEFNIGHSIISRAVLVGMDRAVREMSDLLREG